MQYCTKCIYPATKPDLWFDENGVCSACLAYENRKNIDWKKREEEFKELISNKSYRYDCIVPVSGGKDSHYQIIKAKEYGLKILAVTVTTDDLSVIGRRNLNNISKLGVDHIEITTNPNVRRKINAYTLREIGDISWAEHITIFSAVLNEANERLIPLIIWGENPQNEYGGPKDAQMSTKLDNDWLQEFGGLNGLRIDDLIDQNILSHDEALNYKAPTNIYAKSIFLGYYFPWDGLKNAEIASEHGFERYPGEVEGCGVDYENLDNHQTGIHDYFKWLKFGFGRATDIACNHIRRGLITREEGKEFALQFDGAFPRTYLGKPLDDILAPLQISVNEFMEIADRFTNKALFEPRQKNKLRPKLKRHILSI